MGILWRFVLWLVASPNSTQGTTPNPSEGSLSMPMTNCSICPRVIDPLCPLAAILLYLEKKS